jgi:hypothetical protein
MESAKEAVESIICEIERLESREKCKDIGISKTGSVSTEFDSSASSESEAENGRADSFDGPSDNKTNVLENDISEPAPSASLEPASQIPELTQRLASIEIVVSDEEESPPPAILETEEPVLVAVEPIAPEDSELFEPPASSNSEQRESQAGSSVEPQEPNELECDSKASGNLNRPRCESQAVSNCEVSINSETRELPDLSNSELCESQVSNNCESREARAPLNFEPREPQAQLNSEPRESQSTDEPEFIEKSETEASASNADRKNAELSVILPVTQSQTLEAEAVESPVASEPQVTPQDFKEPQSPTPHAEESPTGRSPSVMGPSYLIAMKEETVHIRIKYSGIPQPIIQWTINVSYGL